MFNAACPTQEDTNTGSKASIEQMKLWMTICQKADPCCNRIHESDRGDVSPKRILDVGPPGACSSKLVTGGRLGQYATLSHCWGAQQPTITTKATMSDRERGIPNAQLPQTYRDAVHVCRELGIQYLWIDSLCIIQDSEQRIARKGASNPATDRLSSYGLVPSLEFLRGFSRT
jgi:hypothetical protein